MKRMAGNTMFMVQEHSSKAAAHKDTKGRLDVKKKL